MSSAEKAKPVYRFGPYVADVRAGELYKRGKKNKVQQQPMQVLGSHEPPELVDCAKGRRWEDRWLRRKGR